MVDIPSVKQTSLWLSCLVIRNARTGDLPELEWEGEYAHFRRVYADAFERSQTGRAVMWVADYPNVGIIGQTFVQLICDRPELADGVTRGYIYAVRVRPEYRSQGVGTRLLNAAEDDLRRRGYTRVTLNVARENVRAEALYVRLGFRVIAPEPGIWSYPDEKGIWRTVEEPAWRMEKQLV
ncbi:MAG: GNAT family N-acetyltransferase [Chloroflexi bacterium]|nr:GNAT family N-acetyltransferase [Chloroflexota bacterium]MCL4561658.1 GNAT family N-acetyltransferase [Chloroflexota bacterium]